MTLLRLGGTRQTLTQVLIFFFCFALHGVHAQSLADLRLELRAIAEPAAGHPTTRAQAEAVARGFDRLFAAYIEPVKLSSMSATDLQTLFDATNMTAFYTEDLKYLAALEQVAAVLEEKGAATQQNREGLYREYVQLRLFDQAGQLNARHHLPGTEPLPALLEHAQAGLPSVLEVDARQPSLERRSVDWREGPHVVVIAHPHCHFSQDATRAIGTDPAMLKLLAGHTIWMIPPERRLYLADIQKWNRDFPDFKMVMSYRQQEWAGIDHWGTPTFYFFNNGKLSGKVEGWPPEGNMAALFAELKKIGLN